jgi:diguanylate cyclase (GGDEF)-like protein
VASVRSKFVLPIVVLFAVLSVGASYLAGQRATASREAQADLASISSDLSELQDVPWHGALGSDQRTRHIGMARRLNAGKARVDIGLGRLAGHADGVDLTAVGRLIDANLDATDAAADLTTSRARERDRASAVLGRQNTSYRQAVAALDRAQVAFAARARRAGRDAGIVATSATMLLLVAFVFFYRRSGAARARAESLAAEVEMLLAASREEALTDPLTGLANRRALMNDLEARMERREDTIVALFDLDGFKEVNDSHGHPEGDAVLRRIAQKLSRELGDEGVAYRLGGDEFCIVAPRGALTAAVILDIGRTSLTERWPHDITASAGAAVTPDHGTSVDSILSAADERLYADKNDRRAQDLEAAA